MKTVVTSALIVIVVVLALFFAFMQHKQVVDTRVTTVPDDLTVVMETSACRVLTKQVNGNEIYLTEAKFTGRSCQVFFK